MNGDNTWEYMVRVLSGNKYEPLVTEEIARLFATSNGIVIKHQQYKKLTEKLYTPTSLEKFTNY